MGKSILAQIAELETMPVGKLKDKWAALLNTKPPTSSNRKQLISRIAYRLQELTYGGVSEQSLRRLETIAAGLETSKSDKQTSDKPISGTKFIREWQGKHIEVTALESGFEFRGKCYRSLTAIASEITGTKWNGPEFFGLRQKKKGA